MEAARVLFIVLGYGVKAAGVFMLVQALRGLWWIVHLYLIAPPFDPLRHLPGPDAPRLTTHFSEVMDPELTPDIHLDWVRQFGKTFRYHGFGAHDYRLMTFDLRAVSYVLNSPTFEKPWQTRRFLSQLLGQGVFSMEGEKHKIQRRIMAPAFTSHALRSLAPIMLQKAEELRDKWVSVVEDGVKTEWDDMADPWDSNGPFTGIDSGATDQEKPIKGGVLIDVAHWTYRATLDVIGLAGFDYPFRALETETEEIYLAYRSLFSSLETGSSVKRLAELFFPILEKILPDEGIRQRNAALKTIRGKGEEIVRSKRQAIMAEIITSKDVWDKDILSLLIKANLSENPSTRLSDSELLDQISTFLFAGSDTTALAISWALYHLAFDLDIQTRLRDELANFTMTPSSKMAEYIDALDNLPFLDAVVRETLRLSPPVHGTIRVATKDEVIPLSEPIILRNGSATREVHIRKGSYVHIPIEGLNYSKDIWGKDSWIFRPDRWFDLPATASKQPGLANLMSFTFGPHACIGWRFSLIEMKVFLASLIPHLIFERAVYIGMLNTIVTRPYVKERFEQGPALPLRVSRYKK